MYVCKMYVTTGLHDKPPVYPANISQTQLRQQVLQQLTKRLLPNSEDCRTRYSLWLCLQTLGSAKTWIFYPTAATSVVELRPRAD